MEEKVKRQIINDIVRISGGYGNISDIDHCTTRIRIRLNDESKVTLDDFKKIPNILGAAFVGGQYQIVVGVGVNAEICEMMRKEKNGEVWENVKAAEPYQQKGFSLKKLVSVSLQHISAIAMQIFPVLIGSGLISGFLALYRSFGGVTDSTTYQLLSCIGAIGTYSMGIFIAWAAAKRFQCNVGVSLFLACLITYPNFIELVGTGEPISFFFLPVYAGTYTGSFFPMIITVAVQAYVEKKILNVMPKALRASIGTALVIIVMSALALIITAPVGLIFGQVVAQGVAWFYTTFGVLGTIIACTLWPLLIMTGAHMAMVPYMMNTMALLGYENLVFPASIGANYSQIGACLAVALKAKTAALKADAGSAAASAACIITEPALYGIDMKLRRPLIGVLCGCLANGLFCGFFHVVAYTMGSVGIWGLPMWADPSGADPMSMFKALIAMGLSVAVAFIVTWVLGFDETDFATKEELENKKINTAGRKA